MLPQFPQVSHSDCSSIREKTVKSLEVSGELVVLAVSVAFFLATLYVKFRDITYIWEVILQAGFYGTPVLYSLSLVPAAFRGLLLINPLAQVIQDARYVIVTKTSVTAWGTLRLRYALIPVAVVAVLAAVSVVFFKRSSKYFAENI